MKTALSFILLFLVSAAAIAQEPKKVDQAWLDKVAALNPEEQAKAVGAKLQELNFKMPEIVKFVVADGQICQFSFLGNGVRDITPLAALKHLKKLSFAGTQPQSEGDKPRVEDLAVLNDMKFESLNMAWCKVKDLARLRGCRSRRLIAPPAPASSRSSRCKAWRSKSATDQFKGPLCFARGATTQPVQATRPKPQGSAGTSMRHENLQSPMGTGYYLLLRLYLCAPF